MFLQLNPNKTFCVHHHTSNTQPSVFTINTIHTNPAQTSNTQPSTFTINTIHTNAQTHTTIS